MNNVKGNKYPKLKKLDHKKYISRINKKRDLEYLDMKLKDLWSMENTTENKNHNKEIIEKLKIRDENESINNYDTRMFVLNMKFRQWLQLFTFKKTMNELLNSNKAKENKNVNISTIKDNLINIKVTLKEMSGKNDIKLFSLFTFYVFNYEAYFCKKTERKNLKIIKTERKNQKIKFIITKKS